MTNEQAMGPPDDDFEIEVAKPFNAMANPYPDIDGEMIVPDYIGEIVAWRVWRVTNLKDPSKLLLQSLGAGGSRHSSAWTPGKRMEAFCMGCGEKGQVPGEKCSCGYYAAKTKEHLLSMAYHRGWDFEDKLDVLVIGEVAMSGKIIPGTQGWRAQFARPISVAVPFVRWRVVKPLRERYPGVKVELENFLQPGPQGG